jgi:hypothetical protein
LSEQEKSLQSSLDDIDNLDSQEHALKGLRKSALKESFKGLDETIKGFRYYDSQYFRTYGPDVSLRRLLFFDDYDKKTDREYFRVMVNELKPLESDLKVHILEGKEYIYRPFGKLLLTKSFSLKTGQDKNNLLGRDGFLINMDEENGIAYIFHGPDYITDPHANNNPKGNMSTLQRLLVTDELTRILKGLEPKDGLPVDYQYVEVE